MGEKQCCNYHLKQSYRITQRACGTVTGISAAIESMVPGIANSRAVSILLNKDVEAIMGVCGPLNQSFLGRKKKTVESLYLFFIIIISTNTITNTGMHVLTLMIIYP